MYIIIYTDDAGGGGNQQRSASAAAVAVVRSLLPPHLLASGGGGNELGGATGPLAPASLTLPFIIRAGREPVSENPAKVIILSQCHPYASAVRTHSSQSSPPLQLPSRKTLEGQRKK